MRVNLGEIESFVSSKLQSAALPTTALLGRCRLLDDQSKYSSAFSDPRYLPFYYYLGCVLPARNLFQIGFRLGLSTACFLQGCRTVQKFFGFQRKSPDDFYSPRLARGNVRDHFSGQYGNYVGEFLDLSSNKEFDDKWDVVIIDDETSYDRHLEYLDMSWRRLSAGGVIVMDYLDGHTAAGAAFRDFSKTNNRVPIKFQTRYGAGLIQR